MSTPLHTDPKLLALLRGASLFSSLIDPQGLLSGGRLTKLCLNLESSFWSARYRFPTDEFVIAGRFKESLVPTVDSVSLPGEKGEGKDVRLNPSETLMGALGRLNEIPVRLRRVLSPTARKRAFPGELTLEDYTSLVGNALFWGIELHNRKEPMKGFSKYAVSYEGETDTDTQRVLLTMSCALNEGEVSVETDANVYGLGNKKVILRKNLGMNRMAAVRCTVTRNGKKIPSLKAAFDLYSAIPVLYGKGLKENQNLIPAKAK